MAPAPGESADEWWAHTGWEQARHEQAERDSRPHTDIFDVATEFFHDVPPQVTAEAFARGERRQSQTPFHEPWPLVAWPPVPTRFLLCRNDRFFPAAYLRRVAQDRLERLSDSLSRQGIPSMSEPGRRIVAGNGLDGEADRLLERLLGARAQSAQEGFDLGERLLDGSDVGRVRR